jgi:hypothetical protein
LLVSVKCILILVLAALRAIASAAGDSCVCEGCQSASNLTACGFRSSRYRQAHFG